MTTKMTKELIDRIFKEPGIKYEFTEFETLGKPIHEILSIYPKTVETGRDAGKTEYYLKSFVPFSSGKEEVQVHVEGGKSAPEEIVRQLWIYKLIQQYGYQADEIDLEKSVQFGTEVGTKAVDIIVYTDAAKERQQTETASGEIDYCSIKHISGRELTDASKCQPIAGATLAGQNDLLLAITGATIGKIGIVKRYNQLAFSGDLFCLMANPEINPHYLLVALDHSIGQVQFTRWITVSTNGHLALRDVRRILVPRLKKSTEDRIAELVEESLSMRVESEKLLDQAKTRVEQLIEEEVLT
ncbi:MAG: hypothetical protein SRB2_03067 [Desulfobacteraceae bacterium Eth-SRB2]|nr:MAG: hypothetical protein SRB2_03067 [Desulfobacteraceae bacterium Eth-SRB2]